MNAPLPELDLHNFWMPFTANREFKQAPRLLVSAKDMHYTSSDGRRVLDATSGLWCVNAGHCRQPIIDAIKRQAETMDFAPTFQMGHPGPFEAASRLARIMPGDLEHVFFTNSGSESADTALKIALAYHRARGEAQRVRFIGRERGYHGVNFGGTSVGGMPANRKVFGNLLPNVSHLRATHDLARNAYSRGQPAHGADFADELERIVALHDASNIAAVIVEPMAGSAGVLIPPKGYLERLRQICDKHGILLIFDEVITGFGRLGASFAAERFAVLPDLMTLAKGLTNATVPMGAVVARRHIHDALMNGPTGAIELFHGYTYSGHPLATAAASATLRLYAEEDLFNRGASMAARFEDAAHSLRGLPRVIDIRNLGLVAGIELENEPGVAPTRAFRAFVRCFERGLLVRVTGDIIALSPPLICEPQHIEEMFGVLAEAIRAVA
jgi:beta-alanine--pyruvate transaminase